METDPLIPNRIDYLLNNDIHSIDLEEFWNKIDSSIDGLTTDKARSKRNIHGLNYIDPPISLPNIFCCLNPCLSQFQVIQQYNECIAENALVKRNSKWIHIDSISLVPGDIIRITVGEVLPADIRIIKSDNCTFDASKIIGTGVKVRVSLNSTKNNFLDAENIGFLGYKCITGECTGVTIATGKDTLLAKMISSRQWPPE